MSSIKHNRLVARGSFVGTPEQWSWSTRWRQVFPASSDIHPSEWNETDVSDALAAFHGGAHFCNAVRLDEWRAYDIGEDGKTVGAPLKHVYTPPVVGSSVVAYRYPLQVSMVISFQGANPGNARNGRAYMPGPATGISSGARMDVADQAVWSTAWIQLVTALNHAMFPALQQSSSNQQVNESQSDFTPVEQQVANYRFGRVYDTLRTRRNQLLEDYLVTAAPSGL